MVEKLYYNVGQDNLLCRCMFKVGCDGCCNEPLKTACNCKSKAHQLNFFEPHGMVHDVR